MGAESLRSDRQAPRDRGPHPLPLFLSLAVRRTKGDRDGLAAVLAGLRRYQEAPLPPPMPAGEPVARRGGVSLLAIAGPADGPTVVVVPSLINAPSVLDLAPGRSLLRFLGDAGYRVLLVRWGPVGRAERRLGLAGLVSVRLLPLLDTIPGPFHLVGYCLGGTLALGAAASLPGRLRSLSLIATPWHFDGFDPAARRDARDCWQAIEPVGRFLGAVPVSLLNPLFWRLDEAAVVAKFRKLGTQPAGDPHVSWFAAVEDWANSGAPLPIPAARDLFVHGFGGDRIGRGCWRVAGRPVRPEALTTPILDIGATGDRIVPPAARLRLPGIARRDVAAGHVGMVVGSGAMEGLWKPLSTWLAAH